MLQSSLFTECLSASQNAGGLGKPQERLRKGHSSTIMCVTLCSWGSFSKRRRSTPSQMEHMNHRNSFLRKYAGDRAQSTVLTLLLIYAGNKLQESYIYISHQLWHVPPSQQHLKSLWKYSRGKHFVHDHKANKWPRLLNILIWSHTEWRPKRACGANQDLGSKGSFGLQPDSVAH